MINIRPASDDLRNKLPEPEKTAMGSDESVFLKKNGYGGTRVLFSIEQYSALIDDTER